MYGKLAMTCFKYVKKQGKTGMVDEPSHVKLLSLNQVCKIGLTQKTKTNRAVAKQRNCSFCSSCEINQTTSNRCSQEVVEARD